MWSAFVAANRALVPVERSRERDETRADVGVPAAAAPAEPYIAGKDACAHASHETAVSDTKKGARLAVLGAVAIALLWFTGMGSYALIGPGASSGFGAHLLTGLGVFCVIIVGPLLLVVVTLNWIVRRIAGTAITLLFIGMARGGLSQGFGVLADIVIVLVSATLVASMLFFLSRPSVMMGTGDFYSFLRFGDVFSKYSFRRKVAP